MKKLLVAATLFITLVSFSVQASEGPKVGKRVAAAFQKEFVGARAVKWELISNENIYHAQFILNNERFNAFFEEDGTLLATGRFIPVASIPLLIRKNVNSKYNDYRIQEVIEYTTNSETTYLIAVENEKARLLLQGYNSGSLYVFKKEKKNNDVAKL
jgi:hypothetical protein